MTVYRGEKCLRDYLVSAEEGARFLKVTRFRFRQLVEDGFILRAARKGFFRLGNVLDGYVAAAAVVPTAHKKATHSDTGLSGS